MLQADAIIIRSSVAGTQRKWSGTGAYWLVDIDLRDQNSTNLLTVYSGTDSGNNTNFVFEPNCLAPTAAAVSIGGRVVNAGGRGISKANIQMIDRSGNVRYAMTNSFGFYHFADVPVGETFVLTVSHKTERFANPTLILNISEESAGVNFTALER